MKFIKELKTLSDVRNYVNNNPDTSIKIFNVNNNSDSFWVFGVNKPITIFLFELKDNVLKYKQLTDNEYIELLNEVFGYYYD